MDRNLWRVIGVVGTRTRDEWESQELVFEQIRKIWVKNRSIICSGGCGAGGDRFAKNIAYMHQLPYLEFPAQWNRLGKRAGFDRNTDIAEWADILIACVSKERTGGTEDTIKKFVKKNGTENLILV